MKDLGLMSSRVMTSQVDYQSSVCEEAGGGEEEEKTEGEGRSRHIWEPSHVTEQEKGPTPGLNLGTTKTYCGDPAPRLFSSST